MTGRHGLTATLPWMRQGTAYLLACVGRLTDDQLQAPSGLPGWRRAHVAGHVARNAEALARLATWARTGAANPMYTGPEQRAAEIEASAALPAAVLRSEIATTAAALDDALAMLDDASWAATVRSAQGREIPAAEIPWMRIREVWIHAVDLEAGAAFGDLPGGVVDLLLDDVTGVLSGREDCPPAVLRPSDRDREWRLGPGPATAAASMTAPAADLAGWLTGRVAGSALPGEFPALPRWL
jgi:maleylpyruvate isomerase